MGGLNDEIREAVKPGRGMGEEDEIDAFKVQSLRNTLRAIVSSWIKWA